MCLCVSSHNGGVLSHKRALDAPELDDRWMWMSSRNQIQVLYKDSKDSKAPNH